MKSKAGCVKKLFLVLSIFSIMVGSVVFGGAFPSVSKTSAIGESRYGVTAGEAVGFVTVSFADYGVRVEGDDCDFPIALGSIIPATEVPLNEGDTIATVTLRLLDSLDIGYSHTGTVTSSFYLSCIKNFKLPDGTAVKSFGEFDSGSGSGWMISLNNWFINMGASEFKPNAGDVIRWQNTCQFGMDIGSDWNNQTAKITGVLVTGGVLSPAFTDGVKEYELWTENKTVRLEALQENYGATLTYKAGDVYYELLREIPVVEGTRIELDCVFGTDEDRIVLTVRIGESAEAEKVKLEKARTDSLTELNAFRIEEEFREPEKAEIEHLRASGLSEISGANSETAILSALENCKIKMAEVKTAAQLDADELNAALNTLRGEKYAEIDLLIGEYVKEAYSADVWGNMLIIVQTAKARIESCTTLEEIGAFSIESVRNQLNEAVSGAKAVGCAGYFSVGGLSGWIALTVAILALLSLCLVRRCKQ